MQECHRISELKTQTVGSTLGWSQFIERHNPINPVDGAMVLNPCTWSDDALYLYQVSRNISKGFTIIEQMSFAY